MKRTILSIIMSLIVAVPALSIEPKSTAKAAAKGNFERPPTFSARQILPSDVLKSRYHEVQDVVKNDGFDNHYTITSPYGTFQAVGNEQLLSRINEISAISRLKGISSSNAFITAAKNSGIDLVTAPVRAVGKVYETVSDPQKLGKTITSVPEGVVGLFRYAANQVEKGADAVSGAAKGSKESGEKGVEAGTSLAEDYLGYTEASAKWYRELRVDPYTDNDVVRSEIRRISRVEAAFNTAFFFVPGIGGIAAISEFNKYAGYASFVAEYADPAKARGEQEAALAALGVDPSVAKTFLDNKAFTPTLRLRVIKGVQAMKGVKGHQALIEMAAKGATSREKAVYFAQSTELLAKQPSLRAVLATTEIPAGVNTSDNLVLPLTVDYLVWTDVVGPLMEDTLFEAKSEAGAQSSRAIVMGGVSPRCRAELGARNVALQENAGGLIKVGR